jgi:hypothetical protein
MLGVLYECRDTAANRGYQCATVAIGHYGPTIKVCDDNGAAEWDVTSYRPFYHRSLGCSPTVSRIAEIAACRFQQRYPDMRPSNKDAENLVDIYETYIPS